MPRLFDTIDNLLVEIDSSQADALRATRLFRRHYTEIDILYTPEEQAEANKQAEQAAIEDAQRAQLEAQAQAEKQAKRDAALVKLSALNLTLEELKLLLLT